MWTCRATSLALAVSMVWALTGCQSTSPRSRVEQFDSYYRKGCAELGMGHAAEAKKYFQQAAAIRNDHAGTHYHLGVCHALEREDEQALAGLTRAIRINPSLAPAYYNIGTIHLRHRRYGQAVLALERAAELDPTDPQVFNNLAKVYYMLRLPETAAEAYQKALDNDPESRVALQGLCRLALAAGNDDMVRETLERLEELAPYDDEVIALRRQAERGRP